MSILKRGLSGAPVKRLQQKLGIDADGAFGPGTEKAVKEFQKANSLTADGIAGPDTLYGDGSARAGLVAKRLTRRPGEKNCSNRSAIGADGKFGSGHPQSGDGVSKSQRT